MLFPHIHRPTNRIPAPAATIRSGVVMLTTLLVALVLPVRAEPPTPRPVEIHDTVVQEAGTPPVVALTLDACSGRFDDDLIAFLIRNRIPATLFVTRRWLDRNPRGLAIIREHLDLFDVEDHGANHIPAVIGAGRTVYGIPGEPDMVHLRREVQDGADAITRAVGVPPRWYRAATAEYDPAAAAEIRRMGYRIAGFSLNADAGATLSHVEIEGRLRHIKPGDIIIAHMNRPQSDTAEGLSTGLLALLRRGFIFVRLDQVQVQPAR